MWLISWISPSLLLDFVHMPNTARITWDSWFSNNWGGSMRWIRVVCLHIVQSSNFSTFIKKKLFHTCIGKIFALLDSLQWYERVLFIDSGWLFYPVIKQPNCIHLSVMSKNSQGFGTFGKRGRRRIWWWILNKII